MEKPRAGSWRQQLRGGTAPAPTCTFLLRLTAGKKRPSRFSKATGPCWSSLMEKVRVLLVKSSSTPTVAPFVMPPSVLWEQRDGDSQDSFVSFVPPAQGLGCGPLLVTSPGLRGCDPERNELSPCPLASPKASP